MTTISAMHVLTTAHPSTPSTKITTLLLRYPRFIHAEFMTHRVFSRNAASSRAIPVPKLIKDVEDDYLEPLWWGKNEPGMQASAELTDEPLARAKDAWRLARKAALLNARRLHRAGAHKQIVNRILEPFAHITVAVTSTEWTNFLALRNHPAAEPHIRLLAEKIHEIIHSRAIPVQVRDWHLPFISNNEFGLYPLKSLKILSVARCASTSYKTVDGFDMTIERAGEIYAKLTSSSPMHASPLEHVAMADTWNPMRGFANPGQHRNFTGWRQLRAMIEDGYPT